ncbi:unnamed protein product [Rotaria sp. Silwood1]|nr:unnamed protein product [Rotaria sp. Silwood1]
MRMDKCVFISYVLDKTCQFVFRRLDKSSIVHDSKLRSLAVGDFNNDDQTDVVVTASGTHNIMVILFSDNATSATINTYSTGTESLPYWVVVDDFNSNDCLDIAVANYNTHDIKIFLGYDNGTFINSTTLSTNSARPIFISVGDFNNDNKSDIITANYGTDSIGIFFGHGNGLFEDQEIYFTGYDSRPRSLAIGDFNKDNYLDIAIANYGTNNIGILFGFGNRSFTNQQIYTTGPNSNPISIAIGDFNNDQNLDIVVANYGIGNIGILLNHNNGTFTSQITYLVDVNSHLEYVTVNDLDNDNALDIITVDSNNNQLHVFPGYGNGTFAKIATYDILGGSYPIAVAIADFNKDYQSDMAVIDYETNKLLILEGYSIKPSIRSKTHLLKASAHPSTVAIADFNNNNQLDIVVNGYDNSGVRIMFDYINETFLSEISYWTGNYSRPQCIYAIDLNNDDHIDIVLGNSGFGGISVLLGHGDGNFTTAAIYSAGIGSIPSRIAVGDIDNDNHLDIVFGNGGNSSIGIFYGYGNGSFPSVTMYSSVISSYAQAIAIGDINNDSLLDIVVSITNPSGLLFFVNHNNRSFRMIEFYSTGSQSTPYSIALADFNRDNRSDVVIANTDFNEMRVLMGYGNGTFSKERTYPTGSESEPYFVIVTDFNHDDQLDIIISCFRNGHILIFFGHGNGDFKLERTYSIGSDTNPYGLALADFNNDNQFEIVVTLWGNGYVAILTEYYAVNFEKQIMYRIDYAPKPYSVAVGDFNKDNQSDIVLANSGSDTINVRIGLGNGTFEKQIMYSVSTGLHPQYVNTADVDNDGNLDIVTADSRSDCISVNLGYGNGSFKPPQRYFTGSGSRPCSFVFVDLNNDTRLDIIATNEGTDNVAVLFGYNYATFDNQRVYRAIGNFGPRAAVVGDFNNDKYLDIAAVFYTTNNLGIFLGDDNGSFNAPLIFSTTMNSNPYSLVVSDVNMDGQLDVIVANTGTDNIGVFLGYDNGSFADVMTFSTGTSSMPWSVAVADFTNDGQIDIVVTNIGTNDIGIFYGYGNGSFAKMISHRTYDDYFAEVVRIADFNNDNQADIVVVNSHAHSIGILLGYGNGSFAKQVNYSTTYATRPMWVALGDFNNDNNLDMVTANRDDNSMSIFLGLGNGSFNDPKTYPTGSGSRPLYIDVGDFNQDSILDIAVVNYGTNQISVHFGLGDATFLQGHLYSTGSGSQPNTLAIADFNRDDRLDIVVANPGSDTIGVFLGSGTQPYARAKVRRPDIGSQPHFVTVGDFNNDGIFDVALANTGKNNVGIFIRLPNEIFDDMVAYSTGVGSAPFFLAVGDLNNDNHSDIVATNSKTDNIAVFLGYGNGTFRTATFYSTGDYSLPSSVAIVDLNNDNVLDIAIANAGTNTILLLYGKGDGTFGNEELHVLGYNYHPYSIAVTDLNHDGLVDIIIVCYGTDDVEILLKIC